MPNTNNNEGLQGLIILLVIIFVAGGFLSAWWTIQKINFFQNVFWIGFWFSLILIISAIVFFFCFLLKEKREYSYFGSSEILDKQMLGFIALICLIFSIVFFFMMIKAYPKGFSEEAMSELAEAQGKLDEFNYIRDVLTGVEIERLMVEGFDEAIQDICESNNYDCEQIRTSYQSIKTMLEAKKKADNIVRVFGIVDGKT